MFFFDQVRFNSLFINYGYKFEHIKDVYNTRTGYYKLREYILLITNGKAYLTRNECSLTDSINAENQIIMIGDNTPTNSSIIKDYTPKVEFKILHHNMTSSESMSNLKKNKYCKGCQKEPEEPDTTYDKIAQYLQYGTEITFDDIWKSINDTDVILESKYEFMESLSKDSNTELPMELRELYDEEYKKYCNCHILNNEIIYENMMKLMFGE